MRERKYEKGSAKFSQINEGCLRFLATHIKIWHFSILCLYTTSCYLMYLLLKSLSPNWQFHMPCLIIVRLVITWSSWFQHIKFWLLLLPTYDNAQFHEFIIIRQSPSALSNTTPIKKKEVFCLLRVHTQVILKFDPTITAKLPLISHRENLAQCSFWQPQYSPQALQTLCTSAPANTDTFPLRFCP